MSELARQKDANQKTEAGMFYPTGYIVAAFADRETAGQARAKLISKGFGDSEVRHVGAAEMAREAAKNLEHPSFFASIGSSLADPPEAARTRGARLRFPADPRT